MNCFNPIKRPRLPVSCVEVGTRLVADAGFSCIPADEICTVLSEDQGGLFVRCKHGRHFLDQQIDNNAFVGFSLVIEDALPDSKAIRADALREAAEMARTYAGSSYVADLILKAIDRTPAAVKGASS